MQARRRNRFIWLALLVLVGLGSRLFGARLPGSVAAYAGDTLRATAVFLGLGLILPRTSTRRVALMAKSFSVLVEASQLYQDP